MKRVLLLTAALALVAGSASATINVSLHAANQGISDFSWDISGNEIFIWQTWTTTGRGFVEISGLEELTNYTVHLYQVNNSGTGWGSFNAELLDAAGDPNDLNDPLKQPSWIPAGFSFSNECDNLSFAQGVGIPRTSSSFASLYTAEGGNRDYLQFYDGSVSGSGGLEVTSFGLRNDRLNSQSFLLAQSVNDMGNSVVIPEPSTFLLCGLGLIGMVTYRRRRR